MPSTRLTEKGPSAMDISGNKRIIQTFFDSGNCGDMESCFAQLADDVTWTNIGSTQYSGTYRGKAVLMEELLGPLFGKLKAGIFSTVDNIIAEGDMVVAQSRGTAETLDGRTYNNTYCHVFKLRDEKIAEVTEYLDTALINDVFD